MHLSSRFALLHIFNGFRVPLPPSHRRTMPTRIPRTFGLMKTYGLTKTPVRLGYLATDPIFNSICYPSLVLVRLVMAAVPSLRSYTPSSLNGRQCTRTPVSLSMLVSTVYRQSHGRQYHAGSVRASTAPRPLTYSSSIVLSSNWVRLVRNNLSCYAMIILSTGGIWSSQALSPRTWLRQLSSGAPFWSPLRSSFRWSYTLPKRSAPSGHERPKIPTSLYTTLLYVVQWCCRKI